MGKFDNLEVDFIAEKHNEKRYFQVTYMLSSDEVVNREFSPLLQIKDNYPKFVLSMDQVWGEAKSGVNRINILEFLS